MSFTTARLRAGMTPVIREKPLAAGSEFEQGAAVLVDGNGAFAECGANPAAIAGFAESAAGVDSTGFVHTGKKEFPPGYMQATLCSRDQEFHARYMGTLPAAPGGTYGITKDTDGLWKVDFSKSASNQRVKLLSIDWTAAPLNRNRVLVSVLAANVQVFGG